MQAVLFNDGQTIEWGKPDSFVTAIMCALSMSFPAGEDFFIDCLQKGYAALPPDKKEKWKSEVDRFCKEEANHSRAHLIHNQKNAAAYGFVNSWAIRAAKRAAKMSSKNPKHCVASTAAVEHITTVLACWILLNNHVLEKADVETRKIWLWHAKEEIGHRKVAIELYRDMGGSEEWRIKWMRIMYTLTVVDTIRQTVSNVWHMGGFFKLSTWTNAYRILFSKGGVFRWSYPYFKAYGQQDYHISQHEELIQMALGNTPKPTDNQPNQ